MARFPRLNIEVRRSAAMNRIVAVTICSLLLLSAPGCPPSPPAAVTVPAGIAGCFGPNTTVTVKGTYAIAGVSVGIDRSGKISSTGQQFKVDETGQDELAARENVPVDKWDGTLVTAGPSTTTPGCFTVDYKSAPSTIAGNANCVFEVTGTICPGPPCTGDGTWQAVCRDGSNTTLLGSGTWTLP